jgi:hypothetical protein
MLIISKVLHWVSILTGSLISPKIGKSIKTVGFGYRITGIATSPLTTPANRTGSYVRMGLLIKLLIQLDKVCDNILLAISSKYKYLVAALIMNLARDLYLLQGIGYLARFRL